MIQTANLKFVTGAQPGAAANFDDASYEAVGAKVAANAAAQTGTADSGTTSAFDRPQPVIVMGPSPLPVASTGTAAGNKPKEEKEEAPVLPELVLEERISTQEATEMSAMAWAERMVARRDSSSMYSLWDSWVPMTSISSTSRMRSGQSPVFRQTTQRVIEQLYASGNPFAIARERVITHRVPHAHHARIVDLEHEARVGDREIFHSHRLAERQQVILVRFVVLILVV